MKPTKAVREMTPYSPPTSSRRGKLRLDFNENSIGCSPKVVEALRKVSAEDLSAYPEYGKFREIIAGYGGVKAGEIVPTNGSDEAINAIITAYVERGQEIIIPTPSFAMFYFYAQRQGAKIREVMYEKDFSFPTEGVLKAIGKKTGLVIICNPNNPTGTGVERDDIERVLEKARENEVAVIVDEAYFAYMKESVIDLINKYNSLFVLRTFSKAFGLAGLRAGYVATNEENASVLRKSISPYSVNMVAVIAVEAALSDLRYVRDYVKEVDRAREIMYIGLGKLGLGYMPTRANFLMVKFGAGGKEVVSGLNEKGILVRDVSAYPMLKDYVRIGIGTVEQTKELLNAIKEIYGKEGK